MADTDQTKLKIFEAKTTPFNQNFVDQYMAQLAAAMSGGNTNAMTSTTPPNPSANQSAPGNYKSPDFSDFFKKHDRTKIEIDPSYYDQYLNSPEGQSAIDRGDQIIQKGGGTGGGSFTGGPTAGEAGAVSNQKDLLTAQYNKTSPMKRSFEDLVKLGMLGQGGNLGKQAVDFAKSMGNLGQYAQGKLNLGGNAGYQPMADLMQTAGNRLYTG